MENELKQQLTRIRLATIALRHNVRHAFDEFRERFAAWRPTDTTLPPLSALEPETKKSPLPILSFNHHLVLRSAFITLLFGLSVILGVVLKSSADERFTIGHEDYRLTPAEQLYNLNELRERALANGAPLTVDPKPTYPVCTDDIDVSVDEAAL